MKHRPLLLVVLDGWGHREEARHNAIRAEARHFQELCARYPHTLLSASGEEVGLPLGLMGNSEVGHTNLGAGRIVWQEITRIDRAIREGAFFENAALRGVMEGARKRGKALHLLGLVSDGGVHSSDQHLSALLDLARRVGLAREQVLVHAMLDGRDTLCTAQRSSTSNKNRSLRAPAFRLTPRTGLSVTSPYSPRSPSFDAKSTSVL